MALHALLGPSSAKRWMSCPPSARATEHIEDVPSPYAEEGTLIHSLAEAMLRAWVDNEGIIPDYELDTIKANKFYSQDVADAANYYVELVKERYRAALAADASAQLRIERRVDISDVVPESFGTADAVLVYNETLEVVDLKGGKGVFVSSYKNEQTRLYAYGALKQTEILFNIKEVVCTICQPRMDNVASETLTRGELVRWVEEEVKPKAALAFFGKGEFKAGEWCQFCKINATCRERARQHMADVQTMFRETDPETPVEAATLTPEEIANLLPQLDLVKSWCGDVQEYALKIAQEGTPVPGFKVVHGRAVRKYTDQEAIILALREAKIPDALVFERSLLGVTAMEKALGKPQFQKVIGPFIDKPPGKPTLVSENDRREPINNAAEVAALFKEAGNE